MEQTLIDQGISLMLYGMGTVFVFLTVLVFATTLMSKLVAKFSPAELASELNSEPTAMNTENKSPSKQVLQAIKQALAEHRKWWVYKYDSN